MNESWGTSNGRAKDHGKEPRDGPASLKIILMWPSEVVNCHISPDIIDLLRIYHDYGQFQQVSYFNEDQETFTQGLTIKSENPTKYNSIELFSGLETWLELSTLKNIRV